MEEVRSLKDVQFESFLLGYSRESKLNISLNIDITNSLAVLNLFILPEIYTTIAENTNLYAIIYNTLIIRTFINSRY